MEVIKRCAENPSIKYTVGCDASGRMQKSDSRYSKTWKCWSGTLQEIDSAFYAQNVVSRGLQTVEEYKADKDRQIKRKDNGSIIFGLLDGEQRADAKVIGRTAITFDLQGKGDSQEKSERPKQLPTDAVDYIKAAADGLNCAYLLHSTRKHTPDAPRVRLIIPVDVPIQGADYRKSAIKLATQIGLLQWMDPASFVPAQPMFIPTLSSDSEYIHICVTDRKFLSSEWIDNLDIQVKEDRRADVEGCTQTGYDHNGLKADPTSQRGIPGCFNRYVGGIVGAIQKYSLPYKNPRNDGVITDETKVLLYTDSTSGTPGLRLYADSKGRPAQFAVCNHTSSKAGKVYDNKGKHKVWDSFRFVMVEKFGPQAFDESTADAKAKAAECWNKMLELAMEIPEVKAAVDAEQKSEHFQPGRYTVTKATTRESKKHQGGKYVAFELTAVETGQIIKPICHMNALRYSPGHGDAEALVGNDYYFEFFNDNTIYWISEQKRTYSYTPPRKPATEQKSDAQDPDLSDAPTDTENGTQDTAPSEPATANDESTATAAAEVVQYTKDDFLREPLKAYADIERAYSISQTEGASKQLVLKNIAKGFGINNGDFAKMLKAYRQQRSAERTQSLTVGAEEKYTKVGFTVDGFGFEPRFPIDYECSDENGIIAQLPNGAKVVICPHPIAPTARYCDFESGATSLDLSFRRPHGTSRADREWTTEPMVPQQDAFTASRLVDILARAGAAVTSENSKALTTFLMHMVQANLPVLEKHLISSRMGWLSNGAFIPYDSEISFDERKLKSNALYRSIRQEGTIDAWRQAVKPCRTGDHIEADIIMTAAFASVLVKNTCKQPFTVHLWHYESGSGKTVALMTAASVFGDPSHGAFMASMLSTKAGMQMMLKSVNNLPLIMDELQTMAQQNKAQNGGRFSAADLIYMHAEGVGKARSDRSGRNLQSNETWANILLTSGEQPITTADDREGAIARSINISANGKVFGSDAAAREVATKVVHNYGTAGRLFVEEVGTHWEHVMELFNDDTQRAELQAADIVGKQINSAMCLLTASALMDEYIFHDGHRLTVRDLVPYLVTNKTINIGSRIYSWLLDHITEHRANFCKGTDRGSDSFDTWGEIDDDGKRCYILPTVIKREVNAAGFDFDAFMKWAIAEKKVVLDSNGHARINKRINGQQKKCVVIIMEDDAETRFEQVTPDEIPW